MNSMTEELMADAWFKLCGHLLALRKEHGKAAFESYVMRRWSISKSRAHLYCDFATFCKLAREHMLRLPDSPDNLKPILSLPQKHWMQVWRMCVQYADGKPINAQSCAAMMDHFGIVTRKRIPAPVLKQRRLHKAAGTLASFKDGEQLADEIGPNGFGRDWDKAVDVVMTAEQERMTLNGGRT